ncbi:unnamed protein product [Spirodela intermedia]|uniref:Uncharacterized protein n=1 Tax=Spirodela intermedia TaxID=51605 RepID=A0ABN7E9C2_SPIIN|nr:unnamed protein product [Spirodela intermedia]
MAGCHMRFPQNVFGERFLKCSQEELQEKLPSMVSVQMGWSSVKLVSVMVMAGNKSDDDRTTPLRVVWSDKSLIDRLSEESTEDFFDQDEEGGANDIPT